ncbi:MAG: YjbE family putative metal transport protein [Alphaproteobacteria bacterium]
MTDLSALISGVIIDIVLAGDNAIVVGMAAAGLPARQRHLVILAGIAAATVLRILFAGLTMHLLEIIGLTLAGGILLLWVSWKMYREIRGGNIGAAEEPALTAATCSGPKSPLAAPHRLDEADPPGVNPAGSRRKTTGQAMLQVVIADVSMSLDNVLAVAGVAHQSAVWILVVGLVLSVALMGVASNFIARLLNRHSWISWVGLGIVTFVALRMIWDGSEEIIEQTAALNIGL